MRRVYIEKNVPSENLSASAISLLLLQQDDFGFPAIKTHIFRILHLIYSTSFSFVCADALITRGVLSCSIPSFKLNGFQLSSAPYI